MSIVSSLCPAVSDQPPALIRSAAALVPSTRFLRRGRLSALGAAVVLGALCAFSTNASGQGTTIVANQPMGEAKGVLPGRVVWAHDPNAVNQNCVPNVASHAWY